MIELKDIFFKYRATESQTLKGISLNLDKGQVMAIVGPSGGGKSTLLRVIAGLENPISGKIKVADDIMLDKRTNVKPEKRGIGMVFQDYALFPHMTVRKNIEYGISDLKKQDRDERVEEVLDLVDMKAYEKRYPDELSGGQQQRIALARALAPKPGLLLLDEPFSNLDSHLLEKVRDDLFRIIRSIGTTTIMVTHNIEDAKTQADKIISIVDGKVDSIKR